MEIIKEKKKWYVLRVVSGKERKCKELIDKEIEKNPILKNKISNVILPLEKVYKIRNGKKYSTEKNFYPGYILIEGELNGEVITSLELIPDVMHFLKEGKKAIPLREIEVNRMLNKIDEIKDSNEYNIPFIVGENVQITDGPFESFNGKIIEINNDKKMVKLNVKIFGRDTSLELNFLQIDKF